MLVLGVDGGGSKTEAAVGDAGRILGRARAGTCKLSLVSRENAEQELRHAIEAAMRSSGTTSAEIKGVCAGVAGVSDAAVQEFLREAIQRLVSAPLQIVGDHVIAYEAAFGDGPGALIIAGTGSVVRIRDTAGQWIRAGGWGPAISDEGSGFWIGKSAVSAAMRAFDSGEYPALLQHISQAWGSTSIDELVTIANNSPAARFAQLFPVVLDAAGSGDVMAAEILTRAGEALARLLENTLHRLRRESPPLPVALAGGVFEHSGLVREAFRSSLAAAVPGVVIHLDPVDPVLGAVSLAGKIPPAS